MAANNSTTSIATQLGYPVVYSNDPNQIISPTIINAYSALTIPAYYRAIEFISGNLSSFSRSIHKNGVPTNHYLTPILQRRPNGYQNPTQLYKTWFAHAANIGNGYLRVDRNPVTNQITAFHNLIPEAVVPFRYVNNGDPDAPGYGQGIQQFYYDGYGKQILFGQDVLHLQGPSWDGHMGLQSVFLHRDTLQSAATIQQYQIKYLMRGTVMKGAIEIPQEADEEQVDKMVALIKTYFRGPDADRDMMVLSGGAHLNNATLSPADSQLLEQDANVTKKIAQITGVNPEFLYEMSGAKYNNLVNEMGELIVRYLFRVWIEQIEDEVNCKVFSDDELAQGYTLFIDATDLIRGNTTEETARVVALKAGGIITGNEARGEIHFPPTTDPNAQTLKISGDTSPPKPIAPATPDQHSTATPAAEKFSESTADPVSSPPHAPHITLSHFSAMLNDAASRVHGKTDKAVENAKKKFENNPQGWTAWANVFANEQTHYAATAVAPVFQTYANLSGKNMEGRAHMAGTKYGQDLQAHLYAVGKTQETKAPDLAQICLLQEEEN